MTLARKGSRLIVIDGVTYRWRVRRRPTYSQGLGWSPLRFAVELADHPGRVLVVTMPCAHPGNWLNLPSTAVLPATVTRAVRHALADGWDPARPGAPAERAFEGPTGATTSLTSTTTDPQR